MSEVSSARAPEKKKNRLLMSCRKCGYRFLWELKDREEGQNHCPCCFAARPWDDKPWEAPTGQDIQRWYYNQKSDPSIKRRKYDKLSTSLDIGYRAGEPRIYKHSTSFALPTYDEKTSHGWRPWSKVQTSGRSAQCVSIDNFDRTYSRAYSRTYSRPYNVAEEPKEFSYPTSYCGQRRDSHFNTPGSGRTVVEREGRDYKSYLQPSYQIKSYDRKVVRAGSSTTSSYRK